MFEDNCTNLENYRMKDRINMICDYCGDKFTSSKEVYLLNHNSFHKDACKKCKYTRQKDKMIYESGTDDVEEYYAFKGWDMGALKPKLKAIDAYNLFIGYNVTPMFSLDEKMTGKTKLPFICNVHVEGGIQYKSYEKAKHRKQTYICKYCNEEMIKNKFNFTYDFVDKTFSEKGYILLTNSYQNCYDRLEYVCRKHIKNGVQEASFCSVRYNHSCCYWCKAENMLGELHPLYKGNSKERETDNGRKEYKEWRRQVFIRDNYTCQCCGKRRVKINAHHLYSYKEYKKLRTVIQNGITLCEECHLNRYKNSFHSIYGNKNFCPEDLYEYIQRYQSGEFDKRTEGA